MQDLGPDMEELFRRASENYPLKQGEDKWHEIASKINGKPSPSQLNKRQTRYRKYYVIPLLLLLFVNLDFFFIRQFPKQNFNVQKLHENEMKEVTHPSKINKSLAYKISEEGANTNNSKVSKDRFNRVPYGSINTKIVQQVIGKTSDPYSEKIKNVQSVNQPINLADDFELNKSLDRRAPQVINSAELNSMFEINNFPHSDINLLDTSSRLTQFISSTSNTAEKKVTKKISMHGLYYGLLLGAEVNTVKNQDMNKVGLDIGLIGGYRFSKHLSAETGLLFSQKYYTTSGKYFSLKEIGAMMPAAMKVIEVNGASKVVEIPVHLLYDFSSKLDHRYFFSAGFSSYILTTESNRYHTSLNGAEYMMYGTYKNNRSYFAASLDLAIGYEKNIGKKSNIRFQPYVQLPVKGIGVGNLKVTSAGVHIAITRSAQ